MTSIAYPNVVNKSQVMSDLGSLTKETHWTIKNVNITNEGGIAADEVHPSTSVDFVRTDPDRYVTAHLDIAPIITAFKKEKNIQIVYLVSPSWRFSGVQNFDDRNVSIRLTGTAGNYQYRIQIKDHNFDKLVLPIKESPAETEFQTRTAGTSVLAVILVVVLAFVMAFLVYFIVKDLGRKHGLESKRRS